MSSQTVKETVNSSKSYTLQLPQPGRALGADCQIKTIEFEITSKTTIKALKTILQDYGLPLSGSKPVLIQRIRNFAQDRDSWTLLFRPRVKHRRGNITGNRVNKHSARRIANDFGLQEASVEFPSKYGIERVQQPLDNTVKAWNSSWAAEALSDCNAGRNKSSPSQTFGDAATDTLLHRSVNDETGIEENILATEAISIRMRRLERNVSGLRDMFSERLSRLEQNLTTTFSQFVVQPMATTAPTLTSNLGEINQPNAPFTLFPNAISISQHPTELRGSTEVPVPAENIDPCNLAVVRLGDEDFTYDQSQVPKPPAIHLARDLSRLFREWHQSNLLRVNGRGIPVKYWGEIYKKQDGGVWAAIKVMWGNWKFIAEEREKYVTEEEFWSVFKDAHGERLKYMQILERLKQNRAARDSQDATAARRFFGGDLNHPNAQRAFEYTKSGVTKVMTRDVAVAEKWRQLLAQRPDIALWHSANSS